MNRRKTKKAELPLTFNNNYYCSIIFKKKIYLCNKLPFMPLLHRYQSITIALKTVAKNYELGEHRRIPICPKDVVVHCFGGMRHVKKCYTTSSPFTLLYKQKKKHIKQKK